MSTPDLDIAQRFLSAFEDALRTGDLEPVAALLAPDVECVMPQRPLHGVDAVIGELSRARPSERFEIDFENGDWKVLGNGRFSCEILALYRSKVSDDLSYSRDRSFELTIGADKVSRLEMRFAN
jgi:ketosteroid isomerase-like protein